MYECTLFICPLFVFIRGIEFKPYRIQINSSSHRLVAYYALLQNTQ